MNIPDKPKIITEKFETYKKYTQGFTKDYKMDGLEFVLENRSLDLNIPLYLWILLISSQKDESYKIEFQGALKSSNNKTFPVKSTKEENKVTTILNVLTQNQWLPDKNGNFHKPSEIILSDLPDDFEKESLEAKSLADKLGFKKDIEQELLSKLPPEKREIYNLVRSFSKEDIQDMNQFLEARKRKSQFPEGKAPNKDRREKKAKEKYVSSKKKKSEKKERLVRITQDQIDKRTSLREWYQNDEERVICQICKSPSHFKNRQGKYYFEAVEMVKDEKEYDANALALCPSCAAKYLYGEKTEDEEVMKKLIILYNDLNNGSLNHNELKITISLCGKTADIQFVEKHLIDLSPIFVRN